MKVKNRFNRVLLVRLTYPGKQHGIHLPSGLGYIAEYLKQNNILYDFFDMCLDYTIEDIDEKLKNFNPDLIAVTMMTFAYKASFEKIQQIKEKCPKAKIIVGGPHVSTLREAVLEECNVIDFGIVLEGEETIVELCKGKRLSSIKGLIHRTGKKIIYNGNREFIDNLDIIPFPKYDNYELGRYFAKTKKISIVSSRGCPFSCIYCPVGLAIGKKFRVRSAKNIADEIEYWYGQGHREFEILDDNFTLVKERVYEICDEIERRKLVGLKLSCDNGVRADKIDKPLLKRMKDVGFYYIAFGVEAGNNKMLKVLKKGESIETIKRAIKDACDLGFDVTLFFLVGSPFETMKDVHDSFKIALSYPVTSARFYNIIPYPNTELFQWLEKNSYLISKPEQYLNDVSLFDNKPLFLTPELSIKKRVEAMNRSKAVLQEIQRRNFERKYKKYWPANKIASRLIVNGLFQDRVLAVPIFASLFGGLKRCIRGVT